MAKPFEREMLLTLLNAELMGGETVADARGVKFRCPLCMDHFIACEREDGWLMHGTSVRNLTLTGDGVSDSCTNDRCAAHFYVRSGNVVMA